MLAGFWFLFDRWLWRVPIIQALKIADLPDLSGEWVGSIGPLKGQKRPIRYRISQTFTSIHIVTETDISRSETRLAHFFSRRKDMQRIVNFYECQSIKIGNPNAVDNFFGLSEITITRQGPEIVLIDNYFTNREPQTKGQAILHRPGEVKE